jgi:hypothetical protein
MWLRLRLEHQQISSVQVSSDQFSSVQVSSGVVSWMAAGSSIIGMLPPRLVWLICVTDSSDLRSVITNCSYDAWNYPINRIFKSGTHYLLERYQDTRDSIHFVNKFTNSRNSLTQWNTALENETVDRNVKKLPVFRGSYLSLACSQGSATGPYPVPDKTS